MGGPPRPAARPRGGRPQGAASASTNEDAVAHALVWGRDRSFADLRAEPPRPGEQVDGEATRFGALAMRLWLPVVERAR